jgi:hypothetical protein
VTNSKIVLFVVLLILYMLLSTGKLLIAPHTHQQQNDDNVDKKCDLIKNNMNLHFQQLLSGVSLAQ